MVNTLNYMEESTKKLRIIFSSNALYSNSGYGNQMHDLLPQIKDAGYPLAHVAFFGLEGAPINLNGIKVYPKMGSMWGEDALLHHGNDFNADISMCLQDIWTLEMNTVRAMKRFIPWTMVDHQPPPPGVLERLQAAYRIITASKFGKSELSKLGFYSTYIPLTVDTEIFKPLQQSKAELRKEFGIPPDIFLFGMVSANKDNPPRKSFQEVIDAFEIFHKKYPKSGIYFHTILNQQGGFPIDVYARSKGIDKAIYHLEPYTQMFKIGKPEMSRIMNSLDCLLAPSTNEGFGVPLIEAQACGIPVITNNFTAMPELITKDSGLLTDVIFKRFSPMGAYIGHPDTQSIYNQMIEVYNRGEEGRKKMGEAGRKNAVDNYDSKTIFKTHWLKFFETLENEVYPVETPKVDAKL